MRGCEAGLLHKGANMIFDHRFHRLTQIVSGEIQVRIRECYLSGKSDQLFRILLGRKKRIGENL